MVNKLYLCIFTALKMVVVLSTEVMNRYIVSDNKRTAMIAVTTTTMTTPGKGVVIII